VLSSVEVAAPAGVRCLKRLSYTRPSQRARSDNEGNPTSTGSSTASADEPAESHQNTNRRQRPTTANHRIDKHHADNPESVESIATTTLHRLETFCPDF